MMILTTVLCLFLSLVDFSQGIPGHHKKGKDPKAHKKPPCEFLKEQKFKVQNDFFKDCDFFIDKSQLSDTKSKVDGKDRLYVSGTISLEKGKTTCVPDGSNIITNSKGVEQKIANHGIKLRILETRHTFPIGKKECRGEGVAFLKPRENIVHSKADLKSLIDNPDYNCDGSARGIKAEKVVGIISKDISIECEVPSKKIDLISMNEDAVVEVYIVKVEYLDKKGSFTSSNIEIKPTPNPERGEQTLDLGFEGESIAISASTHNNKHQINNIFGGKSFALAKGTLYDLDENSNDINSYNFAKRFHMKCDFDAASVMKNFILTNIQPHRHHQGSVSDLRKSSKYNLFDNIEYVKDETGDRLVAKNWKNVKALNVDVEINLDILEFYRNDGIFKDFTCQQQDTVVNCDINQLEKDGLVTLSLYAGNNQCKPITTESLEMNEYGTISLVFDVDQFKWQPNPKNESLQMTEASICSSYGICKSITLIESHEMAVQDKWSDILEEKIALKEMEQRRKHHQDDDDEFDDDADDDEFDDDADDEDDYDDKYDSDNHGNGAIDEIAEKGNMFLGASDEQENNSHSLTIILSSTFGGIALIAIAIYIFMRRKRGKVHYSYLPKNDPESSPDRSSLLGTQITTNNTQHVHLNKAFDDFRAYQLKRAAATASERRTAEFH